MSNPVGAGRRIAGSPGMMYVYVILAFVVLWVALAASGSVRPILLPQPAATLAVLARIVADPGVLLSTLGATGWEVLVAFAIAGVVGTALGVFIGTQPVFSRAFEPLLANLNAVPIVLLYPLLLGAMGSGALPKIIVGAIAAGLPIAISAHWAARSIDLDLLEAARAMGARRAAVVRKVMLPSILPGMFAGLRTGLGLTVVTVIAGEFLSSTAGLGTQLAQAGESFQTPALYAWLIVTVFFTACAIGILNAVQAFVYRKVHT